MPDRLGVYTVQVFCGGNPVDRRNEVVAWNRREAYAQVRNEMQPHSTWTAQITRKTTKGDHTQFLQDRGLK